MKKEKKKQETVSQAQEEKKHPDFNWDDSDMTVKKFLFQRYILLLALICAVLSILMDREIIEVEPRVTNAFTIAAAVGVIMHLLRESFARKAAKYRATLERMREMEEEDE